MDPEKTQAIFPQNSNKFVINSIVCQLKTNFFFICSVLVKFSKNISPKLDFFTELKQIFRKLKDFQDKLKKNCEKLKVLPTRVGLACRKMSNKKAWNNVQVKVDILRFGRRNWLINTMLTLTYQAPKFPSRFDGSRASLEVSMTSHANLGQSRRKNINLLFQIPWLWWPLPFCPWLWWISPSFLLTMQCSFSSQEKKFFISESPVLKSELL